MHVNNIDALAVFSFHEHSVEFIGLLFVYLKTKSHCIVLADLKLATEPDWP